MAESFNNTFRSFASGSCAPTEWEEYFSAYDSDAWDAEGDGVLQFRSNDEEELTMVIVHWRDLGFLLQLSCRDLPTNRSAWCKFSVRSKERLTEFEERDDLRYPVGCFLPPKEAWLAVEDFLNLPTEPSTRIQWVDDNDVEWPE